MLILFAAFVTIVCTRWMYDFDFFVEKSLQFVSTLTKTVILFSIRNLSRQKVLYRSEASEATSEFNFLNMIFFSMRKTSQYVTRAVETTNF